MFHTKHFTLEEAQAMLPSVNPLLERIIHLKRIIDEKGYDLYKHQMFGGIGPNGTGKYPEEVEELVKKIYELTDLGVLLKGIDNGLIDFPHLSSDNIEVYLCYLYGEDRIRYWHQIEDGFAGRRSIDEL